MLFIYDILLNFNDDLYDFYEWESDDKLLQVKKIPIFRISSLMLNDIYNYDISIEKNFLSKIYLKNSYFTENNNQHVNYMMLVTDATNVVGLMMNDEGKVMAKSVLLVEEELGVLDIAKRLEITNILYDKQDLISFNDYLTRNEKGIKAFLLKEISLLYKKKNMEKLFYYYYEYFNNKNNNIEEVYNGLLKSLWKNLDIKHYKLYDLIKLSYQNNN